MELICPTTEIQRRLSSMCLQPTTGASKDNVDADDRAKVDGHSVDRAEENCVVCMSSFENPKELDKCGHRFCADCIDQCFKRLRPVCPICGTAYGQIKGNMPPGRLTVDRSTHPDVPGYPGSGLITITYHFDDGIQTNEHPHPGKSYHGTTRTAYLPNNSEGNKVCSLLEKAFNARLTFTVGQSATTGLDDQVIWNDIHHKTSLSGGPTRFGYPDPTYLNRVQQELASKGIK